MSDRRTSVSPGPSTRVTGAASCPRKHRVPRNPPPLASVREFQPTSSSTVSRASFKFNSRREEDFEWFRNKLFFRKVSPLSFFFSKGRKFLCMFNRRAVQQFRALVLILERRRFRMIERISNKLFFLSLSSFQREENSYVCSTDEQFNNFAR